MKRLVLLLSAILFLSIYINAQFDDTVFSKAIVREFSEINSNNEITVSIKIMYDLLNDIDKDNYARLVETLPNKSECTLVEVGNAETNKTLNVLKLYWDVKKLPKEDFTIKYILKIDPLTPDKCIEGEFGYIDKNNNREFEVIGGDKCFEK